MRVAVATCKGRVCQRLLCAEELVVLDIHDRQTYSRRVIDLADWPGHGRAARIEQLRIDALICGAVSRFDGAGLENSSIRLMRDVAGPVEAVVEAVLSGTIASGQSYWASQTQEERPGS